VYVNPWVKVIILLVKHWSCKCLPVGINSEPMTLPEYIKSLSADGLTAFALKAGTSAGYLKTQLAYGHKSISPELALAMEKASDGALDAAQLCPDFPWDQAAKGRCETCKLTVTDMD
jgi:DNA-binding transcriptional regulator YdaS (Cro superfamily)